MSGTDGVAEYIVVFKKTVSDDAIQKHADDVIANGGQVQQRYDSVLKGFSAVIPDSYLQTLQSLQGGEIDYIGAFTSRLSQPDGVVTTQ
ncbi:hypothetical protein EW146_g8918 [Bondarzewia mesenterica]|uniref:Inhibitor I9 domain-containing protein n=1 Tax=Bondarzewia mesenterica TaxID=1095465 RepID=A0A4S4LAK5_9AGAM|nr:hypothetical protein EW146_g8918 [Bondarzewia mesenterica]